jgi:hypothetical protein
MLSPIVDRVKTLKPVQLALVLLAALALVGSGTAVASNLITGSDIKDHTVQGRDIANATITHANIKNGSVLSKDIADGHVTSQDLQDNGVNLQDLSSAVRGQLDGHAGNGKDGLTGPQGEKGDTGARGPGGPQGAPGQDATAQRTEWKPLDIVNGGEWTSEDPAQPVGYYLSGDGVVRLTGTLKCTHPTGFQPAGASSAYSYCAQNLLVTLPAELRPAFDWTGSMVMNAFFSGTASANKNSQTVDVLAANGSVAIPTGSRYQDGSEAILDAISYVAAPAS